MLHAGVLKKFGLYGLLRLAIPMLPEGARHWATLLIVLLLGNIIYVGLVTSRRRRLDWMLGYSSVMHMGYIFLGIASFWRSRRDRCRCVDVRSRSLNRAAIWHRRRIATATGTLAFDELGGLARVMPFAGLAFGLGVFAAIGLPGFANFAGEIMIFFGAFRNGWEIGRLPHFPNRNCACAVGRVLSTVYMLRATARRSWALFASNGKNCPILAQRYVCLSRCSWQHFFAVDFFRKFLCECGADLRDFSLRQRRDANL
jgi:NADH-quinone oxidoreductase subunit M